MMVQQKYDLEQVEKPNVFKNFDYFLLVVVVAISIIGIIMVYSVTATREPGLFSRTMLIQIGSFLIGLVIAIIIGAIDYHIIKHLAIYFYIANIFMMLLVYSPIGMVVNGSRSWLNFKIITYQPAELMKLATILMIAICLENFNEGNNRLRNAIKIIIFFSIPFGLVVLQKDLGTAMVFFFTFALMLFIAGLKLRYFIGTAILGIASFPFIWRYLLDEVRKKRFLSFIDPAKYSLDSAWQASQARLAIGSGQLFGKGVFNGPLNTSGKIPVRESDFIFSVIGEELGFIGSSLVVVLFFLMLIRLLSSARKASEPYGNYVIIGVFAMFLFHYVQNIGMNLSLLPITGIPLPFVSKGGSAIITNYFSIGVVLGISSSRVSGKFFD